MSIKKEKKKGENHVTKSRGIPFIKSEGEQRKE